MSEREGEGEIKSETDTEREREAHRKLASMAPPGAIGHFSTPLPSGEDFHSLNTFKRLQHETWLKMAFT